MGLFTAAWLTVLPAAARAEGSQVISAGWVYIQPHGTSGPLTLTDFGGQPVHQPQIGTAVEVRPSNTLLLGYEYYWTDQISTLLALGLPPTQQLRGAGALSSYGVLGESLQYSPAVVLRWHFVAPDPKLRPFVGLGVSYTWYRRERITNEAFASAFFGANAKTEVSASPSWSPVYSVGVDYQIDADWSIGLALACTPLKTRITVRATDTQYGVPFTVVTDLSTRVCAGSAVVGYRF